MRIAQPVTATPERRAIEACVARLFTRCPELSGFSILEDGDLYLVDVALNPGYSDATALREEIVAGLSELLEDRPGAFELLRGRTFARRLH